MRPGTLIAGRYRILDFIGRGGAGEVYRAEDMKLDQAVALKFLPRELDRDDVALSRFLNEVRVARQLSHPNACRVFDVGEADGRHFLSMEYVQGEDLASLLRRKGRLPPDQALAISRQICAGLAAAHERGILHRDLKPSNILIDERGVARIADFGLAEVAQVVRGSKALEGTPFYMSPEQLAGGEVTLGSDLYALGLIMYEIFAGRPAYEGRSLDDLRRARQTPPRSLTGIAPGIDQFVDRMILRCLDTEPARRPSGARAVAAVLPGSDPLAAATAAAQQRADRIAAFRAELNDLRRAGVLRLGDDDLAALEKHHEAVIRDLVRSFDVDVSERGKQLSLGMRMVSLIGAIALAASVFYFFYRVWGVISLPSQLAILAVAPVGALISASILAARERAGYFTSMAASFAFASFALDTRVLSTILNRAFSPWELMAWGAFALVLAYGYRLRVLLVAGAGSTALFLASGVLHWGGFYWPSCFERPESFFPAGVLALLVPALRSHRGHPGFDRLYRILGFILLFLPAIILAVEGELSFLPIGPGAVRTVYVTIGFCGGCAAIWAGISKRLKEVVYGGSIVCITLLYIKFTAWFWDWMPRYLFFLIIGLSAVAVILALKRLRASMMLPDEEPGL